MKGNRNGNSFAFDYRHTLRISFNDYISMGVLQHETTKNNYIFTGENLRIYEITIENQQKKRKIKSTCILALFISCASQLAYCLFRFTIWLFHHFIFDQTIFAFGIWIFLWSFSIDKHLIAWYSTFFLSVIFRFYLFSHFRCPTTN